MTEKQLKSFKKQYFDPFRRSCKFWYNYDVKNKEKVIYTTLGQLNFFKWAIEHCVLDFIEYNYDKLTSSMNQSNRESKEKKLKTVKFKETETVSSSKSNSYIKISVSESCSNIENESLILSFE